MADYIYLLQTRLTRAQQTALEAVRDLAKANGMTVFLVGGAVRDLTSGAPIRDLDVVVQGSALTLRKEIPSVGGTIVGESKQMDAIYLNFAGGVRMELSSALTITYPKPGKPVVEHASILDDLRRRDFTANAMAISLNEGSYGLLMDPLNGVADIENMELRLVSNYGFIEDPVRMIRAARFAARLGWHLEEKSQQRYDTGKEEGYISAMSAFQQGYETEEIFHEEDPVSILRHLEAEGWSNFLFPAWTSAKINENELNRVRDIVGQLDLAGIHPDPSPAYYPILTAKLAPKDLQALNSSFVRPGFVEQANALDAATKIFAAQFTGKAAAAPSDSWKMLMSAVPEQVLWLAYSSKSAPVQLKFKAFFTEWPQARNRIPYQLMQEMRIHPDLPGYNDLVEQLFFAIMDGKLDTPEAARAFLEPFSPPAPPPPVNLRRRAVKRETKATKSRKKEKPGLTASAEEAENVAQAGSAETTPIRADSVTALAKEAKPKKTAATTPKESEKKAGAPGKVGTKAATTGKAVTPQKLVKAAPSKKAEPPKPSKKASSAKKQSAPVATKGSPAKKVAKKVVAAKKTAKKAPAKTVAKKTPSKSTPAVKKLAAKTPSAKTKKRR